ncbi:hypothetical protein BGZ76_007259 [Entomortierella beljakovae]|nr:hypothetical protein BGZ76_007259 [Entomortierella beljakovae]
MYRLKLQALTAASRVRNPTLLIASTVTAVTAGALVTKSAHCQHDSKLHDEAENLKDHVQEFTEQVLEMADSPYTTQKPYTVRDKHYYSPDLHEPGPTTSFRRGSNAPYTEEPLVPALLYITAAAFAGSMIARNRNFVFRFLSSSALVVGTAAYCIPRTTNHVIHELRTLDYGELGRGWEHKYSHAMNSATSATYKLANQAGLVAQGLTDTAYEAADKTQETLSDMKEKAVDTVNDLKTNGESAANDMMNKGQDVASDIKSKSNEFGQQLGDARDQGRDQMEFRADQAKSFRSTKSEPAANIRSYARDDHEMMRDNVDNKPKRFSRDYSSIKDDIKRGYDKTKSKTRQAWESAREQAHEARHRSDDSNSPRDMEGGGRRLSRDSDDHDDRRQSRERDGSRDPGDRNRNFGDKVKDKYHDFKKSNQGAIDGFDRTVGNAGRNIHDAASSFADRSRYYIYKYEDELDSKFSRSGSRSQSRLDKYRSEHPGRDYDQRSSQRDSSPQRRRSMHDEEGEGDYRKYNRSKNTTPADPYESYDNEMPTQRRDASRDRGRESRTDRFKESMDDASKSFKTHLKHGQARVEKMLHGKHDDDGSYRGVEGNDAKAHHDQDHWFHLGKNDKATSDTRGHERGM